MNGAEIIKEFNNQPRDKEYLNLHAMIDNAIAEAKEEVREKCAAFVEDGSFTHELTPDHVFAVSCAKHLRELKL
jgi:hypothetical protein